MSIGSGISYRESSKDIRELTGRTWRPDGQDLVSHGQLGCDWTEIFAPVIFEHFRQELSDEFDKLIAGDGTLIIDDSPYYFKREGDDRAHMHFTILAAMSVTEHGGNRMQSLKAYFTEDCNRAEAWADFLQSLPGAPTRVVCDENTTITKAIRDTWPDAEIFHCERHRLKTLRGWLTQGMAFQSTSNNKAVAEAGREKIQEFSAEAIRSEDAWNRLLHETYDISEANFRRWMTTHSSNFIEHIRRRPTYHEIKTTKPVANGALEDKLDVLRSRISWRAHVFHNRERLNRLLLLIQLDLDHKDNERQYNKIIRQWLEANGGRPAVPRRAVV